MKDYLAKTLIIVAVTSCTVSCYSFPTANRVTYPVSPPVFYKWEDKPTYKQPARKGTPPPTNYDYTQGLYQPFATDNIMPYVPDNDEDYYPLYYYDY